MGSCTKGIPPVLCLTPGPSALSHPSPHHSGVSSSPRLGALDANVVVLPDHLQEHMGGKLDC